MRKDIDPIKRIQILPFSNRPEKPPRGPSPLFELLKKAFGTTREASGRLLMTIRGHIARVRPVSSALYETLAFRLPAQKREESPVHKSESQPTVAPASEVPTTSAEPSLDLQHHTPHAISIWFLSARESIVAACLAAWPSRRARLNVIKSWRTKTEQIVRPLTSAVRSLRRRHRYLVDQLNSTHSIVQNQQQEINELAFQLASMKTEVATHKQTIEELAYQVTSLQTKVAQIVPTTHGTTGQSGPPPHGRRGTAATKRNGPGETGPQSKAEH